MCLLHENIYIYALIPYPQLTPLEAMADLNFGGSDSASHLLNDIMGLVHNSQQDNVAQSMPTDCPTREKVGNLHIIRVFLFYFFSLSFPFLTARLAR